MAEEGARGLHRARSALRIVGVAVAVVVAHGLGRPGGGVEGGGRASWQAVVEERLRQRPEFGRLAVALEHYDAVLYGSVDSARDREAAVAWVTAQLPAGRSRFRDEVGVSSPAWLVVEKRRDGGVLWSGELPDVAEWRGFVQGWVVAGGTGELEETLWFRAGILEPPWSKALRPVIGEFLGQARAGRLQMKGAELTLQADFATPAARQQVLAAAGRAISGTGLRLVDRTTTAAPSQPASVALHRRDGKWEAAGLLPDRGPGVELNRWLAAQFGTAPLAVAANVPEEKWMAGAREPIEAFAEALRGDGSLELSGREIRLEGKVAGRAAVHAVSAWFKPERWGGKTVVNRLEPEPEPNPDPEPSEAPPPGPARIPVHPLWLELGRSGGEFEVRGAVAQAGQREELVRVLESGGGRVKDQLVVGGNAVDSPGWWPSLLGLIEMFVRESEEASLLVAGEMIQVSGRMKSAVRAQDFERRAKKLSGLPDVDLRLAWSSPENRRGARGNQAIAQGGGANPVE